MRTITLLFLTLLLSLPVAAAKPRLELHGNVLDVTKVSPGGKVLLLGFQRGQRNFTHVFKQWRRVFAAAPDGTVTYTVTDGIADDSFWLAVDLQSGDYDVAAPTRGGERQAELPPSALKKTGAGHVHKVISSVDYLKFLVVRPAVGAWEMTSGDGGPSDDDHAVDGKIELDPSLLHGIEGEATIDELSNGDVIFVILPHEMRFLAQVVKP